MYTQPQFRTDRTTSLSFAAERGFGTVCAWDGNKPVGSSLPFCLTYGSDGSPLLAFHVARGNQLAQHADGVRPWMMAVNGADSYISPDWYVSPDQVPTWLYQAVHLTGPVRLMKDGELPAHLDMLSAKFEGWLAPKPAWTTVKMSSGRLEAMKKAIIGLVMSVEDIEGSFKLNQHKSDVDYAATEAALARQKDDASQTIASAMRERKPQLFADPSKPDTAMPEGNIS